MTSAAAGSRKRPYKESSPEVVISKPESRGSNGGRVGSESSRSSRRSVGRPRDPGSDEAILASTRECMAREGYGRMTLDIVAKLAGVTKPTIYRRWPTKADLAVAAIRDLVIRDPPFSDNVQTDLLTIMSSVRRGWIEEGTVALLGSMFPEHHHNPRFVELLREQAIQTRRNQIETVLRRGQENGQVREDLDVPVVIDFLLGSFLSRHMAGITIPEQWPKRVVTTAMASISPELDRRFTAAPAARSADTEDVVTTPTRKVPRRRPR